MKKYFLSEEIKGRTAIADIQVEHSNYFNENNEDIRHLFLYKAEKGEDRKLEKIDDLIRYYATFQYGYESGAWDYDLSKIIVWLTVQKVRFGL